MQKCFYHAKTDAQAACLGCKMPVCGACQEAGAKGFCEACMRKVAALGEQITDTKKTGMVQSSHKATMLKTTGRPTSQKNVTYCFQHFDVVAAGTCPTCTRAFCQECLDASGSCTHCARHAESAVAPPPPRKAGGTGSLARPPVAGAATAERPRPPARPAPAPAPPPSAPAAASGGLMQPATFFVVAIVVFLLIMAYKQFS